MNLRKIVIYGTVFLFSCMGLVSLMKGTSKGKTNQPVTIQSHKMQEIVLEEAKEPAPTNKINLTSTSNEEIETKEDPLPEADRINQLFAADSSKLSVVETISYTSRVPWMKGRHAWISDYASYYQTTRHFIARSLNRKLDYFSQRVSPGDRFNVFRKDKNIEFHMIVDLSRTKMWLYVFDKDLKERVLLKTYSLGVGRKDPQRESGYLTPIGKYTLGGKVAIYKPGVMGFFQDRKIEMIRVFGTRWIPFEKEVEGCTENAKGYGLHGVPWDSDSKTGEWKERVEHIGKCDSDGCIRLASEDIEEIFAIVISKPTFVEIVNDFHDAHLPGTEKECFSS